VVTDENGQYGPIPAKSPEPSGQVMLGIVASLLFGIGQSREHSRGGFPGDLALGIEIPHRLTGLFVFAEDFNEQPRPGRTGALLLSATDPCGAFSEHSYAETARDVVKDIASFIKQTNDESDPNKRRATEGRPDRSVRGRLVIAVLPELRPAASLNPALTVSSEWEYHSARDASGESRFK